MKKCICLFFLFSISTLVFCQDVLINGTNNNRLLTWEDFTGNPDNNSVHAANTKWNLSYSYQGYTVSGDIVKIKGLKMILEFDQKSSWIKPGKETVPLLKHEQGHFDIGLICLQEMTARLNNANYTKNEFPGKLQTDFSSILNKYILLNSKYDEETNHSQDKANQQKWNDYFSRELKAR